MSAGEKGEGGNMELVPGSFSRNRCQLAASPNPHARKNKASNAIKLPISAYNILPQETH